MPVIHSKGDKIETTIYDKAEEVIEGVFESFLSRYQIRLEASMKASHFIYDCVQLLFHICNKIYLNRNGSYIERFSRLDEKQKCITKNNKNKQ